MSNYLVVDNVIRTSSIIIWLYPSSTESQKQCPSQNIKVSDVFFFVPAVFAETVPS